MTSPQLTSPHTTPHHLIPPHPPPPHPPPPLAHPHLTLSHLILPHPTFPHPTSPYPTPLHITLPHLILPYFGVLLVMFVDLFYLIHSSIMLYFQEKLLLEPYTSSRNVAYVILAPDNDTTIANVKMYFKELSAIYEVS